MKVKFTHKGWFGLCPVLVSGIETDCPYLEPRIPMTGWLIELSAWIFQTIGSPTFPIQVTGTLKDPRWIKIKE